MTLGVRPLVAGNWKMNGLRADLGEILAIRAGVERGAAGAAEVAVFPPATLLREAAVALSGGPVALGAQDCHAAEAGPFTGDISAAMLKDAGCAYVIVGHSERRAEPSETDARVRAKAQAALRAGLTPIVCVGETRAERDAGAAVARVRAQALASLPEGRDVALAYEPIWAIGAGVTPTLAEIAEMHRALRLALADRAGARLLYGGSVKPGNAEALLRLDDVDGALVGGASLKASEFLAIASVYRGFGDAI